MDFEEFRTEMKLYRRAAEADAGHQKDPHIVGDRLRSLYRKFDVSKRCLADRVIAEWVLSEDGAVRFEAQTLIEDFKILSSVSAPHEFEKRLVQSALPGDPYERKKIRRILVTLED